MYRAEIIADSIGPNRQRLTTILMEFPKIIGEELLRHRSFSFSFGSTRAIPMDDPFIPISWGKNGKGMQPKEELSEEETFFARREWLLARDSAVTSAERLVDLKAHKQIAGRVLQPFAWHVGLVTATDWKQFFFLRCHPDAQPEFQKLADMVLDAYMASTPTELKPGEWHLPYFQKSDVWVRDLPKCGTDEFHCGISAARCARVSYLHHDTGEPDAERDYALFQRLRDGSGGVGHNSPMEHQAQILGPDTENVRSGNLRGVLQFRKTLPGEDIEDSDFDLAELHERRKTERTYHE